MFYLKEDEELAKKFLESKGFIPERFTKNEMTNGKHTPDFKVCNSLGFYFFCALTGQW